MQRSEILNFPAMVQAISNAILIWCFIKEKTQVPNPSLNIKI
ncbi:hypothetical protein [Elizabethkingia anophelis]|uniref:Uncharacterized protein n=1 Tax=Elizabethkingia anophelis TaxID=1117645 RepID=A0A7Z7PW84_9FLAO|nr:hypothetical protein [Elizabethkingia anophelis]WJK01818.1 hypothetical protein QTN78_08870 [Elizabethkingia anophelis]WLJ08444.1 hypothetical protein Q8W09_06790 [Elizabethkingia anophelis]WQI08939.1 hypothetical protein U2S78_06860 [Elizabethkingia anophelis]SPW26160.1 Uncharacterised protein [Elizabethkingia anophelis]STD00452.1 Uncharacterised protein [Elizabethkingia anophelis]